MVSLVFDASTIPPLCEHEVSITIGRGKSHIVWSERKSYTLPGLRELLTTFTVGPKDGPCFTPAIFRGNRRHKSEAARIDIIVLDADCGHPAIEIERAIARNGWEAIIHSTHSHLTTRTTVSSAHYNKWMAENSNGTTEQYLIAHKSYLKEVCSGAELESTSSDGKEVTIRHQPCPKFRIILPLERPWIAEDWPSQQAANDAWKERVDALAARLGLHHDQSCTDTSRLFYLPRTRAGIDPVSRCVAGELCDIWAIEAAPQEPAADLFSQPARPTHTTQDGKTHDLAGWAALYANRFQIVTALTARSPGVFGPRISGTKRHIQCAFESEHTSIGRDGTFVVNATPPAGFTIHCQHNACTHRDRLDHLSGMLGHGWLSIDDLTNPEFLAKEAWEETPPDISAFTGDDPPEHAPTSMPMASGLVGALWRHIIDSSMYPHPDLALAAALTVVSTAMGRRYGWGNLRSNLYLVGLAHSASGKNHVLNQAERILDAAGMGDALAGSEPTSGSGVTSRIEDHPVSVYIIDEIGSLIEALCDQKADKHTKEIIKNLTIIYTKADGAYRGKDFSDRKMNKTSVVRQPHLGILGLSVATRMWKSITRDNIADGSLARFMLFESKVNYPDWNDAASSSKPPQPLVDSVKSIWAHGGGGGNLSDITPGISSIEPDVREVKIADGVQAMLCDRMRAQPAFLNSHVEDGLAPIYGRVIENAKKVAMIHAVGRNPITATVEMVDIKFGFELVESLTDDMIRAIHARVSENEHEAKRKRIVEIVRAGQGKKGMMRNDFTRKTQFLSGARERDDILNDLIESGDILVTADPGKGRAGMRYHANKRK